MAKPTTAGVCFASPHPGRGSCWPGCRALPPDLSGLLEGHVVAGTVQRRAHPPLQDMVLTLLKGHRPGFGSAADGGEVISSFQ